MEEGCLTASNGDVEASRIDAEEEGNADVVNRNEEDVDEVVTQGAASAALSPMVNAEVLICEVCSASRPRLSSPPSPQASGTIPSSDPHAETAPARNRSTCPV